MTISQKLKMNMRFVLTFGIFIVITFIIPSFDSSFGETITQVNPNQSPAATSTPIQLVPQRTSPMVDESKWHSGTGRDNSDIPILPQTENSPLLISPCDSDKDFASLMIQKKDMEDEIAKLSKVVDLSTPKNVDVPTTGQLSSCDMQLFAHQTLLGQMTAYRDSLMTMLSR